MTSAITILLGHSLQQEMARSSLFTKLLYATGLANAALTNQHQQSWLDPSLPYEERLQSFIAQLNTTQKLAMTQGDTEVYRAHQMI